MAKTHLVGADQTFACGINSSVRAVSTTIDQFRRCPDPCLSCMRTREFAQQYLGQADRVTGGGNG